MTGSPLGTTSGRVQLNGRSAIQKRTVICIEHEASCIEPRAGKNLYLVNH